MQIVYTFMKNINILKIIKKKIKPETECIIIFKNLIILKYIYTKNSILLFCFSWCIIMYDSQCQFSILNNPNSIHYNSIGLNYKWTYFLSVLGMKMIIYQSNGLVI